MKKGAWVMLTVNIDLSDRLINEQLSIVNNIAFTESGIWKIHLKLDGPIVGQQLMCSDFNSNTHQVVPITRVNDIFFGKQEQLAYD